MKGVVLDFDVKSNEGILRADDGRRYAFNADACKNDIPLAGCAVDFEESFGAVSDVFVTSVPKSVLADKLFWFLFSFRGRISRDAFLAFLAGAFCIFPLLTVFAAFSPVVLFRQIFLIFLAVYIGSCVAVKRFHDTGTSGWWIGAVLFVSICVLAVLTLYGLLVLFCLYSCFAKGDIGENAYGKEPASCRTIRLK